MFPWSDFISGPCIHISLINRCKFRALEVAAPAQGHLALTDAAWRASWHWWAWSWLKISMTVVTRSTGAGCRLPPTASVSLHDVPPYLSHSHVPVVYFNVCFVILCIPQHGWLPDQWGYGLRPRGWALRSTAVFRGRWPDLQVSAAPSTASQLSLVKEC